MKLRNKLSLFNIISKVIFGSLFLLLMPRILERINTIQTDNQLIEKREQVIDLIAEWGVEYFVEEDKADAFGSYNILKEEYISLERVDLEQDWNFIEVTHRMVDNEIIEYRVLNYSFYIDGEMYLLEIGKSLTSIRQAEKNIRTFTIFFLVVFILFSSFSDISFASMLIRPLEKISSKLKKTTSPLLFNTTPVETTTNEFVYLDATIADLMEKIKDLFQKEKQITANISHELLTPVSVVRSSLENLLAQPQLSEEVATKIEESLKTLHRLKSMVNSLLLIARVESEQYLKHDNFSVRKILSEIIAELLPIAEDRNIELALLPGDDHTMVKANRQLFFIMLYNVVNNALKFSPDHGQVQINTILQNNTFTLSIKDNGNGMDAIDLENLFLRFKKRPAKPGNGSGIGLAIAKTIADFHQVEIHVISSPGKGSDFIFTF